MHMSAMFGWCDSVYHAANSKCLIAVNYLNFVNSFITHKLMVLCTLTFLHTNNGKVIIGNRGRKIAHIMLMNNIVLLMFRYLNLYFEHLRRIMMKKMIMRLSRDSITYYEVVNVFSSRSLRHNRYSSYLYIM